eukprot:5354263-Prymnesium_polylepis.2
MSGRPAGEAAIDRWCTVGIPRPREPVWKRGRAASPPGKRKRRKARTGSPFIAPGGLCTRPPHSVTTVMGVK